MWLGMPDPCLTRRAIESEDVVRTNLRNLLEIWFEAFGSEPVTAPKVMFNAGFNELDEVLQNAGVMSPRMLGEFLATHIGRIESGLRFQKSKDKSRKVALWCVEKYEKCGVNGVIWLSSPYKYTAIFLTKIGK